MQNITSKFFEGICKDNISIDESTDSSYLSGIDDLSNLLIGGVFVMDFQKRCLSIVSHRDIFLCGHPFEYAAQSNYDFFLETVYEEDLPLLIKIHQTILNSEYIIDEKWQSKIKYFYFTIRNKNFFQLHDKQHYIMICYRMKPIFINKKIRYGICSLTISGMSDPGNLRVYFNNTEKFDKYSLSNGNWETSEIPHLDEFEKMILRLAKQGLTNRQIAEEIGLSYERLRHRNSELYHKLGVKNMEQAIVVASNHLMLFDNR
jgi:DNA-binding CsgD family transcriptional regulator